MTAIRTPSQALVVATGTRVNREGFCQQVTRGYYLAPSAGDVDGDGDADAYDGWLSEPKATRHAGDRNPPAGYPVSFKGGSKGHGHRAISLGGGRIRSTDFDGLRKVYRAGVLGNGTIAEVEAAMGVTYLGWSETIDGVSIPKDAPPKPAAKPEEKPVATNPTNLPPVAGLYRTITSLANEIMNATTPGTPNHEDAEKIRDLSHKHDGIQR